MEDALRKNPPPNSTFACPSAHLDDTKAEASHVENVEANYADYADSRCQAQFESLWPTVTSPDRLVLYGFRRFRTSHLLNLRVLEQQIMEVDQTIFEAGLQFGDVHAGRDRLALSCASPSRRPGPPAANEIDEQLLRRLRILLKEYGKWSTQCIGRHL
jgi:hypothetical protein